MQANLRKLNALLAKDAVDLAKNPTMIICIAIPVAFALFYRFFLGGQGLDTALEGGGSAEAAPVSVAQYIVLSLSLLMSIGMGASMSLVYGLAEEKEKHTLRTLMLANVSARQIMLAKGLVALGLTVAVELLCFAVSGAPWRLCAGYLLIGIMGALPVILLSLVAGLASRDQMTAGLYSVPILLLALAPMFGNYSATIRDIVRFAPTGGADWMLRLLVEGSLFSGEVLVPLAITAAWIAVSAIAFKLLYKRLLRDN